jgi:hypothetical protein
LHNYRMRNVEVQPRYAGREGERLHLRVPCFLAFHCFRRARVGGGSSPHICGMDCKGENFFPFLPLFFVHHFAKGECGKPTETVHSERDRRVLPRRVIRTICPLS